MKLLILTLLTQNFIVMEKVPEMLRSDELTRYLLSKGLELLAQGKVRNTWRLDNGQLLVVATDRISIFDFVLNALVPKKGEVLTALTHFWLTEVLDKFNHHLIESDEFFKVNFAWDLRETSLPELPIERCLVVKDFSGLVQIFEFIFRAHIGGSVFKTYQETSTAGGHKLPPGLPKWSKLDKPIFTPSTKEEVGHDVNVDAEYYFAQSGEAGKRLVRILAAAYDKVYAYAEERGILILDTKLEATFDTIVDEVFTPDSSRFATAEDWKQAMQEGRDPYFWDKQLVRDWGAKVTTPFGVTGINKLDPENPEHLAFVHNLEVPPEIIQETARRYLGIFKMITDQSLEEYQKEMMMV